MAKKAVQFGAGNIGRGFIGQLFFESGYETTYIDVVQEVIDGLNARGEFPLRIVGEDTETLTIGKAQAVHAGDVEAAAQALAEADFAATAVGVPVLPKVAPVIAAGIAARHTQRPEPLNFIVCENMIEAGPFLREEVRKHLDAAHHEFLDTQIGFVEASIGRMVPIMTEREKVEDPLLICVEPYCELPVDRAGFKGPIPELKNMKPMDAFGAYVERKLFVHNMSHATASYLGYLRGHEYIWQAVGDPEVCTRVEAAMSETCEGLHRKHGLDKAALDAHAKDLLFRYSNKGLGDQVARIGKDPVRKLGPRDRLVGSAHMCLEQGIEPVHVALGTAAACHFDEPTDPTAPRIQDLMRQGGVEAVLREIGEVEAGSPLIALVQAQETRLREQGWLTDR